MRGSWGELELEHVCIDFRCIWPFRTRLKPIFHPLHVLKKIGRKCPNVQFGHQHNSNLVKKRLRIGHEGSLKRSDYAFQDGTTLFLILHFFRKNKFVVEKNINSTIEKTQKLEFFMKKITKIFFYGTTSN